MQSRDKISASVHYWSSTSCKRTEQAPTRASGFKLATGAGSRPPGVTSMAQLYDEGINLNNTLLGPEVTVQGWEPSDRCYCFHKSKAAMLNSSLEMVRAGEGLLHVWGGVCLGFMLYLSHPSKLSVSQSARSMFRTVERGGTRRAGPRRPLRGSNSSSLKRERRDKSVCQQGMCKARVS